MGEIKIGEIRLGEIKKLALDSQRLHLLCADVDSRECYLPPDN